MSEHQHDPNISQVDEAIVQGERFIEKYLNKILLAVVAVVLVVVAIFGYIKFIKEPAAEKASVELFKAEDRFILGQDSLAIKGEGVATKGLDAIIRDYSGSDAANLAHAYKGIALYDQGKYQEAIDVLSKFESDDAYVGPSIKRLIGDAYAQLGKYQDAATAYEKAASMANNEAISPSCLIKAGHAYEKLGKVDKAVALYEEVKSKYYTAPESDVVDADIIRAKGGK